MKTKNLILTVFLLGIVTAFGSAEGLFQLNTRFQGNSYPLFGSGGGKDVYRVGSVGIGVKSVSGQGAVGGNIDLAILFPQSFAEKIYPATSFTKGTFSNFPLGLDALLGVGFNIGKQAFRFQLGTGFHIGGLFVSGSYLLSFGLGIDAQTYVHLGKTFTVQIGINAAVDFFGTQNYNAGSDQFAGFPFNVGFYTGFGFRR